MTKSIKYSWMEIEQVCSFIYILYSGHWIVSNNLQPIELPYMGGTFFTLAFLFSLARMINILNIDAVFTDAIFNN